MARRADDLPAGAVIDDEFSVMTDDAYHRALESWLTEIDAAPGVDLAVRAAETLRELREHDEA